MIKTDSKNTNFFAQKRTSGALLFTVLYFTFDSNTEGTYYRLIVVQLKPCKSTNEQKSGFHKKIE